MGAVIKCGAVVATMMCLVALSTKVGAQTNYCQLCTNHTLCIYQGNGDACIQVLATGVNGAQKTTILDEHNKYRNKVASGAETRGNPGPQPAAADMNKLIWDNEVASVAQRWADQCTFGHDQCRNVQRFSVGQNVYATWTTGSRTGPNWAAAVQGWYDEVKNFDRNTVDRYVFVASTGHYTQVVWAKSRVVGCGYKAYKDGSGQTAELYVCNYGPAGNFIGQPIYKRGNACSSCACDSTYTSLCA